MRPRTTWRSTSSSRSVSFRSAAARRAPLALGSRARSTAAISCSFGAPFSRKSTAPPRMARTELGMSAAAGEEHHRQRTRRGAQARSCTSRPSMPGICRSMTMQPRASPEIAASNSAAEPNVCAAKPCAPSRRASARLQTSRRRPPGATRLAAHAAPAATGSVKRNDGAGIRGCSAPRAGRRGPRRWCARPRGRCPCPFGLVVTKGSNTFASMSAAMPWPESATATSTVRSSARRRFCMRHAPRGVADSETRRCR